LRLALILALGRALRLLLRILRLLPILRLLLRRARNRHEQQGKDMSWNAHDRLLLF
jgi:hypothetical protein